MFVRVCVCVCGVRVCECRACSISMHAVWNLCAVCCVLPGVFVMCILCTIGVCVCVLCVCDVQYVYTAFSAACYITFN